METSSWPLPVTWGLLVVVPLRQHPPLSTVFSLVFGDLPLVKGLFPQRSSSPNYRSVFSQPGPLWLIVSKSNFLQVMCCHFFVSVPRFNFCICCVKLAWLQFELFSSHIDSITYNLQIIQKSICGHEKSVSKNKVMTLFMRALLWSVVNKYFLSFYSEHVILDDHKK